MRASVTPGRDLTRGVKQSQILTADGERQAAILRARATEAASAAEGQAKPSRRSSTRCTPPTGPKVLAYQYSRPCRRSRTPGEQAVDHPVEMTKALEASVRR